MKPLNAETILSSKPVGQSSADKPQKPCPRGNDDCPIDCCVTLTAAQANAMDAYWQGRGDEVRSGPHMARLASLGLIERDASSRYVPTERARLIIGSRGAKFWSEFSGPSATKEPA